MNLRFLIISCFVFFTMSSEIALARPNVQACPSGHSVSKTFSSGAEWSLCWDEKDNEGVVLSNVLYSVPGGNLKRVLGEASLSQIQTEFDDGSSSLFSVSQPGLGGSSLRDLSAEDCPQGELLQRNGKSILCKRGASMGYIWKKRSQHKQGEYLELFSMSNIGTASYIVSWKFYESGIIESAVGLTGKLSKFGSNANYGWPVSNDQIAVGFTNHYFWRLDFDLADSGNNDLFELIASTPSSNKTKKIKSITAIEKEKSFSLNPVNKHFWRVRDGAEQNSTTGFISYELILLNYGHQGKGNAQEPWLTDDLFITHYEPCERFAVKNPTQNGCAANVSQFVNGKNINKKDVVAWYRASYHHLPRDEDMGRVATRWTGLKLLPRDWSSKNPL